MTTTLPTTDLYFLNSCRRHIGYWWQKAPIKRIGANCFRAGDRHVLIRRDKPALMERVLNAPGPLIYLIDDDVAGAMQSPGLPASYQARLADFVERYQTRLLHHADTIVTSSDVLATLFQSDPRVSADIVRLDPFWALPFADQSHFPATSKGRFDMVHLGTASHGGALAKIAPAVITVLDRHPSIRFTFIGASGSHPDLETHPQVRRLNVMPWRRYRTWLPRQRFHLALYPLEQTPFDLARSANKIFEHAIVGAVGMYPRDWSPAAIVAEGAVSAPEDPTQWMQPLMETVERRLELAPLGKTAMTSAAHRHNGTTQWRIWANLLNLDASELLRR